jgi:hypothetical protein
MIDVHYRWRRAQGTAYPRFTSCGGAATREAMKGLEAGGWR